MSYILQRTRVVLGEFEQRNCQSWNESASGLAKLQVHQKLD
jgi:hypothetical protein